MYSALTVKPRFRIGAHVSLIMAGLILATPVYAQSNSAQQTTIEQLQLQIIEIQKESARQLEALKAQTDQQLQRLQAQIDRMSVSATPVESTPAGQASRQQVVASTPSKLDKLKISGDFRLRYENNSSYGDIPSWDRGVLRGRMAASYQLTDQVTLGGRLVTGDPDNPRTADTTIGDFVSDLDISLDQAYVAYRNDRLFLTGGKFAKPFSSTELVWDGDVNPQGLGGHIDLFKNDAINARLSGVYFLINENLAAQSSSMLGGQLSLSGNSEGTWNWSVHSAYYDYDMGTLSPTAPGGPRGNNLAPGSLKYLSDFNLWDTMATLGYTGFGDRWNVKLIADYVKNTGAKVDQDSGYGFDLFVGRLSTQGDLLFRYGYAQAETDAVLGMFSNDNIILPTNYELHTFAVDYALMPHTFVGLTHYEFRQLDPVPNEISFYDDWASRTRLNLYFTF